MTFKIHAYDKYQKQDIIISFPDDEIHEHISASDYSMAMVNIKTTSPTGAEDPSCPKRWSDLTDIRIVEDVSTSDKMNGLRGVIPLGSYEEDFSPCYWQDCNITNKEEVITIASEFKKTVKALQNIADEKIKRRCYSEAISYKDNCIRSGSEKITKIGDKYKTEMALGDFPKEMTLEVDKNKAVTPEQYQWFKYIRWVAVGEPDIVTKAQVEIPLMEGTMEGLNNLTILK